MLLRWLGSELQRDILHVNYQKKKTLDFTYKKFFLISGLGVGYMEYN